MKKHLTIVIKLGTSSIVDEQTHEPKLSILSTIVETAVALHKDGHKVVLVSSGAIGVGLRRMNIEKRPKNNVPLNQALAAIGQCRLMTLWDNLFTHLRQPVAQVLLTRNDIADRTQYLNAQNTFFELLGMGVIPVVNENDTIAVTEIKFGDNDTLSAITAGMVQADYLFLMTDVDCLYDKNPRTNPDAQAIEVVEDIAALEADVSSAGSSLGTGGMSTKIVAARLATSAGVTTVITRSSQPGNIASIVQYAEAEKAAAASAAASNPYTPAVSTPTAPVASNSAAETSINGATTSSTSSQQPSVPKPQRPLIAARNSYSELASPSALAYNLATPSAFASFPSPLPSLASSNISTSDSPSPSHLVYTPASSSVSPPASSVATLQLAPPLHTRFLPAPHAIRDRQFWLLHGIAPHGTIHIDPGAYKALLDKAGLLPVGIINVEGTFAQQEAVRLVVVPKGGSPIDPETPITPDADAILAGGPVPQMKRLSNPLEAGKEVGRAVVNYSSTEIARIKGLQSTDISGVLGYADSEYVALRENIAFFGNAGALASVI
ncbi:MAG: hypothetical protein M1822_005063 [Bathelium mastoideum]|nr:MAG: hypothetical protein M1822_005063 [Bathelium mastoideum]